MSAHVSASIAMLVSAMLTSSAELPIGKKEALEYRTLDQFIAIQLTHTRARELPLSIASIPRHDSRFESFEDDGVFVVPRVAVTGPVSELRGHPGVKRLGVPAELKVGPTNSCIVIVTDELVIQFDRDSTRFAIRDLLRRFSLQTLAVAGRFSRQYLVRIEGAFLQPNRVADLSRRLNSLREVEFCHPNVLLDHVQCVDPLFYKQWHLHNSGQDRGLPGADIKILDAWRITKGSPSIVIAVIDPTGVEITHPDLLGNLYRNEGEIEGNDLDDDCNGYTDDIFGWDFADETGELTPSRYHGTACAGLALAPDDNGIGVAGVAPRCNLLTVRNPVDCFHEARAFDYARDRGAAVLSNSWVYRDLCPVFGCVDRAITEAATHGREGRGCIIVFSLTNRRVDNFAGPPTVQSHPCVVSVGRCTNTDEWPGCGFGNGTVLLAPSNACVATDDSACQPSNLIGTLELVTTDLVGSSGLNSGSGALCACNHGSRDTVAGDYTRCFAGTSGSAPIVAGVAALVLSVNPTLNRTDVVELLTQAVDTIDEANANYQLDGFGRPFSVTHGYGRINAGSAVILALTNQGSAPSCTRPRRLLRAFFQKNRRWPLCIAGHSGQLTLFPRLADLRFPTRRCHLPACARGTQFR